MPVCGSFRKRDTVSMNRGINDGCSPIRQKAGDSLQGAIISFPLPGTVSDHEEL